MLGFPSFVFEFMACTMYVTDDDNSPTAVHNGHLLETERETRNNSFSLHSALAVTLYGAEVTRKVNIAQR